MDDGSAEVRWAPRVKKHQIRRLYENDARGIVDEELIDEVGCGLYARCRSILDVHAARQGRVRCPRCASAGRDTTIVGREGDVGRIACMACGWQTTWVDYSRTFKRRQLNSGGALEAFSGYIQRFERAHTAREKLLAIDCVIHEFHYSLRDQPDVPTRAAGVNLIEGHLSDVMAFLDALTYGPGTSGTQDAWRETAGRLPWNPLPGRNREAGE